MKPEIRSSQQRSLQHGDPDMAPTITAAMTNTKEHLKLNHKLRKPQVEKLRRERINSCIEQLKSLLGPEILKQQPDSKMEKADILEMTVRFLKQLQQRPAVDTGAVGSGYARCVQEVVNFLSKDELEIQSKGRLLNIFSELRASSEKNQKEADFSADKSLVQTSFKKDKSPVDKTLWRPW